MERRSVARVGFVLVLLALVAVSVLVTLSRVQNSVPVPRPPKAQNEAAEEEKRVPKDIPTHHWSTLDIAKPQDDSNDFEPVEEGKNGSDTTPPPPLVRRWTSLPIPLTPPQARHAGTLAGDALYVAGDGLVFCPIAKAACAEWRKALRWMEGIEKWDTGEIHKVPQNGLRFLKMAGTRRATEITYNPKVLKFVVVREPAERLVSAFLQKCWTGYTLCCSRQGMEDYHTCPYLRIFGDLLRDGSAIGAAPPTAPTAATDVAFRELKKLLGEVEMFRHWVRYIAGEVTQRKCAVNPHWVPHHCRCGLDRLWPEYHIVPFQNMAAEAEALASRMQVPSNARREEIRQFLSQRFEVPRDSLGKITHAREKVDRYYTQELLDLVYSAYKIDYALFSRAFGAEPAGATGSEHIGGGEGAVGREGEEA